MKIFIVPFFELEVTATPLLKVIAVAVPKATPIVVLVGETVGTAPLGLAEAPEKKRFFEPV